MKPTLLFAESAFSCCMTVQYGQGGRAGRRRQHVFVRHAEHGKPTVQLGKVLQLLVRLGVPLTADVAPAVFEEFRRLRRQGLRPLKPRARGETDSSG